MMRRVREMLAAAALWVLLRPALAIRLEAAVVCPEALRGLSEAGRREISVVGKSGFHFCVHVPWEDDERAWEGYEVIHEELYATFDRYAALAEVVLDVGAWIGQTSMYLASVSPHVVAVEPSARAFGSLLNNLALNEGLSTRLFPVNVAVGEADERVLFTDTGSSMDHPIGVVVLEDRNTMTSIIAAYPDLRRHGGNVLMAKDPVERSALADYVQDVIIHHDPTDAFCCIIIRREEDVETKNEFFVFVMDIRVPVLAEFFAMVKEGLLPAPFQGKVGALDFRRREATPAKPGELLRARGDGASEPGGIYEVETLTAGALLERHPALSRVGFVKIDAEGAERWMIRELRGLLEAAQPVAVVALHEVFLGRRAVLAVLRELRSIFPHVMELDGRTEYNASAWRHTSDVLCLWSLE